MRNVFVPAVATARHVWMKCSRRPALCEWELIAQRCSSLLRRAPLHRRETHLRGSDGGEQEVHREHAVATATCLGPIQLHRQSVQFAHCGWTVGTPQKSRQVSEGVQEPNSQTTGATVVSPVRGCTAISDEPNHCAGWPPLVTVPFREGIDDPRLSENPEGELGRRVMLMEEVGGT